MATLDVINQKKCIQLYNEGFSAQQIADSLKVGIGAIYYTLRYNKVVRRTSAESNKIRFEATALSYKLKTNLSESEKQLKLAAVMLYWAEGYKAGRNTVDFANSDPEMVKIFILFLRVVCGVQESRIRIKLYCYEGQDVQSLIKFWCKLLKVNKTYFTKPYVTTARDQGKRGPRMLHGLVHICYSDQRLLRQVMAWIEEYKLCVGGRVVNYTTL